MIDFFYKKIEKLRASGCGYYSIYYKIAKLIVNVLYPLTIPFHKDIGVVDGTSNIEISLTSFPTRIDTVYITIDTLLRQTVKPSRITLWLADEQFPNKKIPKNLERLKERGLTVSFCVDLRSHKKYYGSMKSNPDSIVITVDDDMFYDKHLVERLMKKHSEYPDAVVCNWGHVIRFCEDKKLAKYNEWEGGVSGYTNPSMLLVPVGAEAVLYPPHCIDENVFNVNDIKTLVPYADDLWLKMMCVKKGTKAVRASEQAFPYFNIIISQRVTLQTVNVESNQNDNQLNAILDKYPEVLERLQTGR